MLEPKAVRLHAAHRAAVLERLKSAGWPPRTQRRPWRPGRRSSMPRA